MAVAVASSNDKPDAEPSPLRQAPLKFAFGIYQAIVSPVLHAVAPSRCLYQPTCSEYAYVALSRFGIFRGSWMALRRVARCHPWGKGGLDPVPERCEEERQRNESSPSQPDSRPSDHLS
jgi:uncharacterized protein